MELEHLLLLALVQGITEFLPISSSGHLILVPMLTDQSDQGLAIDIAVHVGTLLAVIMYFWRDVRAIVFGIGHIAIGKVNSSPARLTLLMILATIPVIIAGIIMKMLGLTEALRSMEVIGWATLVFGIALYLADVLVPQIFVFQDFNWRSALAIGLAQSLALVPGTSRSGITMTAARLIGYVRVDAARIALLMSVPTISAAGLLLSVDLYEAGWQGLGRDAVIACVLSFFAALAALWGLMSMLRKWSMSVFASYRVALGLYLLWRVYGG